MCYTPSLHTPSLLFVFSLVLSRCFLSLVLSLSLSLSLSLLHVRILAMATCAHDTGGTAAAGADLPDGGGLTIP